MTHRFGNAPPHCPPAPRPRVQRLGAVLPLAAVLVLAALPAAAGKSDEGPGRGLIGLAADQAIRVNVVRLADDHHFPPNPCRVEVAFLDIAGATIRAVNLDLAPERGGYVELLYSDLLGRPAPREPVRVKVTLVAAPHGDSSPTVVPTVELYDTRTNMVQGLYETFLDRPRDPHRP